ncbi:MAG: serpin family protein [Byssovorax sp.]
MRSFLPLFLLPLACAACEPPASSTPTPPPSGAASSAPSAAAPSNTGASEPASPGLDPSRPAPSNAELARIAGSSNAFAFDFYAKARAQKGNLAVSPASIHVALSMTAAGAKGDTLSQMARVLHGEGSTEQILDQAGKLMQSFDAADPKVTLRVKNRLFGDKSYSFEKPFLDRSKASFGAALEGLDFKHDLEGSRTHINGWIAKETQDRIKDLIPAGGLVANTRLVLTNAIYFLGDWQDPFNKDATRPAPFFTAPGASKDVPTMHQAEHFKFAAIDGVKVLEMPYVGGQLAMTIVLPDAADGLDAVESKLSQKTFDGWIGAMKHQQVMVSLPKFEVNPQASLSLGDILIGMGMPLAFDADKADFTGIANPPSPADRLYISKVFHKAFVKVDEKGTEAAAATAVVMARAGGAPMKPAEFKADHPFLFALRDLRSGIILFMGRVSDPSTT